MSQTCLIGVDLGTSVVKTSLFDSEGHVLADATRATRLSQPMPGRAEQQGDDFYAAALATLQEVVEKA
ncbi:MAG: xylulose kinase, partial [Anaerolineae bacterium]|nr:xylulose kinase [Anaerolineae bacterium]